MNTQEKKAIAEVIESYFTPDSPEGLAYAMYQLKRIYENETRRGKGGRRTQATRNSTGSNHGSPRAGGRSKVAQPMPITWNITSELGHRQNQTITANAETDHKECHRCGGGLEPDQTCQNFFCPNYTQPNHPQLLPPHHIVNPNKKVNDR